MDSFYKKNKNAKQKCILSKWKRKAYKVINILIIYDVDRCVTIDMFGLMLNKMLF